ncbi:MAG: carbonic anhydrase [Methanomicrobiales archaeon]
MNNLIKVSKRNDIFEEYAATPIGLLLEYHNLKKPFLDHETPDILLAMCMDYRKNIRIPPNFAYIMRSGGANIQNNEFNLAYAVSMGGVNAVALIAHDDCGMVNLSTKKDEFIKGMVQNAGWNEERAENYFNKNAPLFEITNEVAFVVNEANRLRIKYPKITVAPLYYCIKDKLLYLIKD